MAPSNGTTSSLSKCVITTPRLLHPQQWHLTMAPSNGTTSSLSKCVKTTPRLLHPGMAAAMAPNTQQWHHTTWHPAMAPYHGTQQWHHVHSVKVCHKHPPPIASRNGSSNGTQHPAMASHHVAPSNGTLPWHPAMAPRPVCQSVS